jgi:hypothetical protein
VSSLLLATEGFLGTTTTRLLSRASSGFLSSELSIIRRISIAGGLQEDLGFNGVVPLPTVLSGVTPGVVGIQGRVLVSPIIHAKVPK